MRLHQLALTALLGASLALTGCGYSCADLCEDHAECDDDDTNPDDCDPICEIIERRNEDMGCDEDFDKYVDCAAELDDVCDIDDLEDPACEDEQQDYSECIVDFCTDHPNNDDC
jgi:hypothetical protein